MTRKNFEMVLVLILVNLSLFAQENDSLKTRKAQITFGYPVGSNGMKSLEYSNNFSFNILYGLNGGVNGAEIGSIFNFNKGKVKGFQLSGVSNINTGYSKGFLLSGVSNIIMDSTSGLFISGVLNYSSLNSKGFLLSGVSNIIMGSTSGLLISGVLNYSNLNSKGFQLATANVAANEFNGFQLGVFNYAKKLKGVQLGVINYVGDGEEGLPIGLISIVKNGYYDFELTGGEVIYANVNYKMGVERFYTIYKIGYSSYKNNPVYSFGLGFGSNIALSEKQTISIDLSANSIVYDNDGDSNGSSLNLLNKFDFNYKYNLSRNLTLLIGPSFNVYITEEKVDGEYGTLNIPYTFYANERSNDKLFMWVGINAGLSFKL